MIKSIGQAKRQQGESIELFMVRLRKMMLRAKNLDARVEEDARVNVFRTFLRMMPKKFKDKPAVVANRNDLDRLVKEAVKYAESHPEDKLNIDYIQNKEKVKEMLPFTQTTTQPQKANQAQNKKQSGQTQSHNQSQPNKSQTNNQSQSSNQSNQPSQAQGSKPRKSHHAYCQFHQKYVAHSEDACSLNPKNANAKNGQGNNKGNKGNQTNNAGNNAGAHVNAPPRASGNSQPRDQIVCYRCNGIGHISRYCGTPAQGVPRTRQQATTQ